jgi:ABC-type multidrug transport system fused ATPase/permease subunit
MSEANINKSEKGMYDDRVDTETDISSAEALVLMGRSFRLLNTVRGLFFTKLILALLAVSPVLLVPWFGKIIVDQVLLQKSFGETEVLFPPFMDPFISLFSTMSPMEIMGAIVITYVVLIGLFGVRGGGTTVALTFNQGQDNATQSEAALSAGSSSAGGLLGLTEMLVTVRLTQSIANQLRTRLFDKLTRLPMLTLDDHRIGDSVYRVMYDTPMVPDICYKLTLVPLATILVAAINVYLIKYSYGVVAPEIVWIALFMVPLALVVTLPMSAFARRLNQKSRASGAATTNAMEESIDNISAVQSLGGMDQESAQFKDKSAESYKRFLNTVMFQMFILALGGTLTIGVGIYMAIYISDAIIVGDMSPGDFVVMLGIFGSISGSALLLGSLWIGLQTNVAAVRRVFFFIDYETEDVNREKAPDQGVRESVSLENLGFQYPDGRWALRDINLDLKVGELVAVVGPTGAGKTTLAYMLPGFLKPTEGCVRVDGTDIATMNTDWLRDQVSYVFQEHMLFSDSIRDNLLLANPVASEAEMIDALKTAGAWEFVETLPKGLDTVLGKAGDSLSVGQQQRLCIARGLVRETKILILDEPTAALDPKTEIALVSSLRKAAEGRLVVVIAHRLSTIRQASKIVFLEDGRLMEAGSHDELMAKDGGKYRQFVELQSNPDYG